MRNIDRRAFFALAGAGLASYALAACSSQGSSDSSSASDDSMSASAAAESVSSASASDAAPLAQKSIVVYFSATGNTKGVAQKIVAATGSETYEITAAQPYTAADLEYNDSNSRTSKETADPSVRPDLGGIPIDFSPYTTVYLGYPIWWGDAPRIMSSFVEGVDLRNATIVPFVTSGSSSIGGSAKTLQGQANGGIWKAGNRIDTFADDVDIKSFIENNR